MAYISDKSVFQNSKISAFKNSRLNCHIFHLRYWTISSVMLLTNLKWIFWVTFWLRRVSYHQLVCQHCSCPVEMLGYSWPGGPPQWAPGDNYFRGYFEYFDKTKHKHCMSLSVKVNYWIQNIKEFVILIFWDIFIKTL